MGIDTNIHIGPFMIVKGTITFESEESVETCSNEKCINFVKNKQLAQGFCPKCGSPVAERKYTDSEELDASDLVYHEKYYNNFEDKLVWTDPMGCDNGVFIPNQNMPSEIDVENFDSENSFAIDLTKTDFDKQINWFSEHYKKQIDILKKEFGEESIEIKCGIVQWFS